MKNTSKKIVGKFLSLTLASLLVFGGSFGIKKSYADEKMSEKELEEEISQRLDKMGGDWQIAIKRLDEESELDLYLKSENSSLDLPAASSIKIFIGLAAFDAIENEEIEDSPEIQSRIYSMLKNSDNLASNQLINDLGGFSRVNKTIKEITGLGQTRLNRFFLHNGKENTATARDLNLALERIYKKDYVNEEHSDYLIKAMTETPTSKEKILSGINSYKWAINKSGELPDRGVENDSVLIQIEDKVLAISLMTQTKNIHYRNPQLSAMKDIGKIIEAYMAQEEEKKEEEKIPGVYYYRKVDLDKNYFKRTVN